MKANSNGVLLTSSGLDSFILWRLLGQPRGIYVRLGHRYEQQEVLALQSLQDRLRSEGLTFQLTYSDRLYLGDVEDANDAHIPYRNLLLLTVAAVEFPDATEFYLGALRGEGSRDKSNSFFRQTTQVLANAEGRSLRAYAPFIHLTKRGLVAEYLKRFPDDAYMLSWTRSCHFPDQLERGYIGCGNCSACFRRWVAMTLNEIEEPYPRSPYQWAINNTQDKKRLFDLFVTRHPAEWLHIVVNNWEAWRAINHVYHR